MRCWSMVKAKSLTQYWLNVRKRWVRSKQFSESKIGVIMAINPEPEIAPELNQLVDDIFQVTTSQAVVTAKSKNLLSQALTTMVAADILNACTFWHMNKRGPSNPNEFAKDVGLVVRWWKRSLTCRLFETNKKVLAW